MGFVNFLKTVAPWTAAAVQFVPGFGPVASQAIKAIADKNSVPMQKAPEPTLDGISEAIAAFTGNGQAMADLRALDAQHQEHLQAMGFQSDSDMEKLAVEDRESARGREGAVRDYTPEVGFYLLTVLFAMAVWFLFTHVVPPENKALVYTMLGSLGTMWVMAGTYFYGTTRSSGNKDTLIAGLANGNGNGNGKH